MKSVTNVIIAGLGGQGVLKASDIVAEAAFRCMLDVKKSELHGMSQRGGSVSSDIRFGERIFSPMIPPGEADYLLVLSADQVEVNRPLLRAGGVLVTPDQVDEGKLPNKRTINIALLGVLSRHLDIPPEQWLAAIRSNLPQKVYDMNAQAFGLGRGNESSE